MPLGTLVAGQGSLTAGDITFTNFQMPKILPDPGVGALLGEFNDIGVSATTNADGTVSLAFIVIDPVTGLPSPLIASPTAGGEKVRLVSYSFTVTNPSLRVHSMDQQFGPGSAITGASALFGGLYTAEPVPNQYDRLIFDLTTAPPQVTRSAVLTQAADGSGTFSGNGGILAPGGNLATYSMANQFGLMKGHLGFDPGGTLDSVTVTFSLAPVGTPVPVVTPDLLPPPDSGLLVNTSGIGLAILTTFAQQGGAAFGLASSNPAALALPPTITATQGYRLTAFDTHPTVDAPTDVTLTASFNGKTATFGPYTVNPATPLTLTAIAAGTRSNVGIIFTPGVVTTAGATIVLALNRVNFSPAAVRLASSNPAVAPVPASFTISAGAVPGDITLTSFFVPFQTVSVDTPVTFSATLNGLTQTTTVTIPKTVDQVQITKVELTVKDGTLKVQATGSNPAAVLTLFNNATGQLIGTMVNNGPSGGGAKYSFQGTVSPVTTLLVKSSLNGTATGAVAQK